jgi:hypothetical protein
VSLLVFYLSCSTTSINYQPPTHGHASCLPSCADHVSSAETTKHRWQFHFKIKHAKTATRPWSTLIHQQSTGIQSQRLPSAAAGIESFNWAVLTLEKLLKSIFFVTMFAQKLLLPALAVITSVAGKSSSTFSLPQE